jgi:hypothetical protein
MNKKQVFILAVLAIVIFALGAQLATAQPVEIRVGDTLINLFPLVISSKAAEAPPGVLYVFPSTTKTDGDPGGRDVMGDICFTEDPDSHFCSLHEIEHAWVETGIYFTTPYTETWVDYPKELGTYYPDSSTGLINPSAWAHWDENCNGWMDNTEVGMGMMIDIARTVRKRFCNYSRPIACCKQMPDL